MILSVDLAWILDIAREAGQDDPAVDYGVAIAAVERHKAVLVGQSVYRGTYARAASLAHTLGRMRWLERSNMNVAVAAAHGYLLAAGVEVKVDRPRIAALVTELMKSDCTAHSVAAVLKTWAV
ncbi:fic family toxin-antitoxin system, toxin component [Streptomyces sp. A3M-1-3]|uniref:fic family toxin-antitoxin system, toxin component n=1 Tax=Streptomyces sp. A3M-1-3 TaxID=2962044 RepID=UPI0020B6F3DB|nr:fic family toxin-antitoxin system, toxin component [Streptomyces sp. A3M-1-3]MCP3822602.1 fic family toxin-antitoxin system, toxin component [Streptomyces sp. A3M-1-3]